jgi:hypothetical protein
MLISKQNNLFSSKVAVQNSKLLMKIVYFEIGGVKGISLLELNGPVYIICNKNTCLKEWNITRCYETKHESQLKTRAVQR